MLGHGGSSAGSYLADPTSPIPSHCAVIILFQCPSASIVATSTLRVNKEVFWQIQNSIDTSYKRDPPSTKICLERAKHHGFSLCPILLSCLVMNEICLNQDLSARM